MIQSSPCMAIGYPGFDEVSVDMDIQVMIVSSLDLQMNSVLAIWSVHIWALPNMGLILMTSGISIYCMVARTGCLGH